MKYLAHVPIEQYCEYCGGLGVRTGRRFCSMSCYNKVRTAWNKDKVFKHVGSFKVGHADLVPKESRLKQAESMSGENNPSWLGGITTPERLRYHCARYRARKLGSSGTHSQTEWEKLKESYGNACVCCKDGNVKLTEDHILPLSKGGSDDISNIQPLCKPCNSRKKDKYIVYV